MSIFTMLMALFTSTAGALIAAVAAIGLLVVGVILLVRRSRGDTAHRSDPRARAPSHDRAVTKWRRLFAMLVDGLGIVVASILISTAVYLFQVLVLDQTHTDQGVLATRIGAIATFLVWLALTLWTGRTVGDIAAGLRYVGGTQPELLARLLRYVGGIGGFILLASLPDGWSSSANLFFVVSVVMVFVTASGRGLPGILSSRNVVDARMVPATA